MKMFFQFLKTLNDHDFWESKITIKALLSVTFLPHPVHNTILKIHASPLTQGQHDLKCAQIPKNISTVNTHLNGTVISVQLIVMTTINL